MAKTKAGRCVSCARNGWAFDHARSLGAYGDDLEKMVVGLKFLNKPGLAGPLGTLLASKLEAADKATFPTVVVPVPLSRRRLRQRGFNQAALIARPLARRLRLPLRCDWLRRTRHTRPQTGLSARARRRNLGGAFRARIPSDEAGVRILLVDDVFTTGATLDACSLSLLDAGATRIDVATVARVP